ncbi:MAG: fibronectin type III domain-containing protein [Candidatus Microsaccharimonas sp.]
MKRRDGFTLVELVIVVAIIAILATLAVVGLTRFQQDGRDSRRSANATTISEALEKYYDQNGEYPSCNAITASGATVSSTTLKGISLTALLVPGASSSETNSIRCGTTLAMSGDDFIQYVGDGSATCSGSGSCLNYKLRYRKEGEDTIIEIPSRRSAAIDSSGLIQNLTATTNGFTAIDLTWGAIPNVTGYTLQRSSDSTFSSILSTHTPTTNSFSSTGLTPGVQYFYRVVPVGGTATGSWSNTASATTLELGTPTLTATVNSTTQITTNWTAVTNADASTRYTLVRATNSTFTAGVANFTSLTGTSHVSSGLTVGQSYYFKVQAVSPNDTGDFSNVAASVTIPAAPTGVTATANSATQITVAWTASAGATGYTIKYGLTDGATTYSTTTASTSLAITANITQGTQWYFKVYATASGLESAGSSSVNATTSINAPAAFNMSSSNNGSSLTGVSTAAVCASGTTKYYLWKANSTNWVSGTGYGSVTYSLSYGQSVTLRPSVRCQKGSIVSAYTQSTNSASYTRPGMNLTLSAGSDDCNYGYCGRVINASWTNVCGTGAPTIKAKQLSAYASWTADTASSDSIKFKGASSPGVKTDYYEVNIGCTSGAASIYIISAYKCSGCS